LDCPIDILGIIVSHNDRGVSLIKENKIIDAINEERVVRKKLIGGFPNESLETLLKYRIR
jgi:predicted NodU family carbamoyl transferase